jgi:hypothetical protein
MPHRVLVLGVPRSGTTWIGQALGRSRGAVYVHEPDGATDPFAFRAQMRDGTTHYPVLHAGDEAREHERLWFGAFAGGKRPGTVRDRIARRAYARVSDRDKVAARSTGGLSIEMRVSERMAVPRVRDDSARAIVVKSVNAALSAEWIYERWTPAVLVVERDLRNVIASWLALGFGGTIPKVYATVVAEAAERWDLTLPDYEDPMMRSIAFCAVTMLALHDGVRAHPEWCVVSHEELCTDSASQLAGAATRLGLEWTEEADAFVRASDRPGDGYATSRVSSELPDQWKHRLSAEQVDSIATVLNSFPADLWQVPPRR